MSDLESSNNLELLNKEIKFIPYLYKILLTKDKSIHYFNNWFSTLEIFAFNFGLSDLIPYYLDNNLNKKFDLNYNDKVFFLKLWIKETTDNNIKKLYENVDNLDDQINLIFKYFVDKMKDIDDQKIKIFYPTKSRFNDYNRDNLIKFYLNYYRFKQIESVIDLERNYNFDLIFKKDFNYSFNYFSIYHNYIFEFNNSEIKFINEFTNLNKFNLINLNELTKIKEFINKLDDTNNLQIKLKELNEIKKLICYKIKNLSKNLDTKSQFKYEDNDLNNYETDELSRGESSRDESSRDEDVFTDDYLVSNDESSKEDNNFNNSKQLNKLINIKSTNSYNNLINEIINQDCLMFNHSVKIDLDIQLNKQFINQQFIQQSNNLDEQLNLQSSICFQFNDEKENLKKQLKQQNLKNLEHQQNLIRLSKSLEQLNEQQNLVKYKLPTNLVKSTEKQNLEQLNEQRSSHKYKLPKNLIELNQRQNYKQLKKQQQNSNQFNGQQNQPKYKLPKNLVKSSEKQNLEQLDEQSLPKYKLPKNLVKLNQRQNYKQSKQQLNQQSKQQLNQQSNQQLNQRSNINQDQLKDKSFSKKLIKIQNSIYNLKLFKDKQNQQNKIEIKQLYPLPIEIDNLEEEKKLINQLKPNLNLIQPKLFVELSSNSKNLNKSDYKESCLI